MFRNVEDYGAKRDGVSDDIFAFMIALYDGDRCGSHCGGTTAKGATVYFPPGMFGSKHQGEPGSESCFHI